MSNPLLDFSAQIPFDRITPADVAPAAVRATEEQPVADVDEPPQAPTKRSRSKRASVPTWDEIMFGPKD